MLVWWCFRGGVFEAVFFVVVFLWWWCFLWWCFCNVCVVVFLWLCCIAKRCEKVLQGNVVAKCWKDCWDGVLGRSVGKECRRELLSKCVVEEGCGEL